MTPLMYAALHGFETTVKYLIPASDVNAANNDGLTALMIAAKAGHSECVERIMRRPSDGNLQDKKGRTALIHAAMQGHAECVDWLIPRCNPNFTDIAGLNALRNAIRAGHVNCIDLLLPVSEAATTEQQQWQLMALASMSNSAICLQRVMDINGFAFGGLNFAHREHSWIFYKLEELILDAVKDGSLESIKILLPITRGHAGYNNMVNTAYQLLEEFPYIALVDYLDSLK
jgi:hypothetical protein